MTEMQEKTAVEGEAVETDVVERLLDRADAEGVELTGPDGLLTQLTRRVLERALDAEMTAHLGYEKGDPAGAGSVNSRNGRGSKTVLTEVGPVTIDVPRDRDGSFDPKIVRKRQRRLGGLDDQIISLYARGMSVRDIRAHLAELYGAEVSPELVSKVTDAVSTEITEWQNRPLDQTWPVVYIDALWIKVRDGAVANRPVYLAVGVDLDGRKHVLGMWVGKDGEGSKFWLTVLTELRNRGLSDALIVCCDGLSGLPEAIATVWPRATVQTCVVHLIRASLRYASRKYFAQVTAALKPIYTAPTEQAAAVALDELADGEIGQRYPAIVKLWRSAWEEFCPFLAFPPQIRRLIYTTNTIESLNARLRKATRNRGAFPSEQAVLKCLYLTIRTMTKPDGSIGATTSGGWKTILNTFSIHFGDRITIN